MFIIPCPTSATTSSRAARACSSAAAFFARSRTTARLSTPADHPQNQAKRASSPQSPGRSRRLERNSHGRSASRNSAATTDDMPGASSAAESRDRRSGLVNTQAADRINWSSAGSGREWGSSGAASSPRRHAPKSRPQIGVPKSQAGLPCRARMILTRLRSAQRCGRGCASRARRAGARALKRATIRERVD